MILSCARYSVLVRLSLSSYSIPSSFKSRKLIAQGVDYQLNCQLFICCWVAYPSQSCRAFERRTISKEKKEQELLGCMQVCRPLKKLEDSSIQTKQSNAGWHPERMDLQSPDRTKHKTKPLINLAAHFDGADYAIHSSSN